MKHWKYVACSIIVAIGPCNFSEMAFSVACWAPIL